MQSLTQLTLDIIIQYKIYTSLQRHLYHDSQIPSRIVTIEKLDFTVYLYVILEYRMLESKWRDKRFVLK